jgi:hypothetical protein
MINSVPQNASREGQKKVAYDQGSVKEGLAGTGHQGKGLLTEKYAGLRLQT